MKQMLTNNSKKELIKIIKDLRNSLKSWKKFEEERDAKYNTIIADIATAGVRLEFLMRELDKN